MDDETDPFLIERAGRLKEAVRRGGGVATVSRNSEIPVPTLNKYIGGRDMKASALVALADACGVSIEWLAAGRGPDQAKMGASSSELARFGGAINEKAHYWALLTLIRISREFYERLNAQPTLAEVFSWVAREYGRASKLPDLPIEFKDPENTGHEASR